MCVIFILYYTLAYIQHNGMSHLKIIGSVLKSDFIPLQL